MNLPDCILEPVFSYLNWNDRARAARVCRQWQRVFHSPSLWRTMVFMPPARPMSRVQYDMKGYRMSCCLRTIGAYVRHYRFVKSEDIFLLNRTLSLIAKFLESSAPIKKPVSKDPLEAMDFSCDEQDEDDDMSEHEEIQSVADSPLVRQLSWEDDYYSGTDRLSDYGGVIMGDPDAEATLNLVLKLQQKELLGQSSSDSSDEADLVISHFLGGMRSASQSVPKPTTLPKGSDLGRSYRRSQSCRYASQTHRPQPPPCVTSFLLDFHCEVDESRAFVYGTGGALLSTIRRVVRQLSSVKRLRFTDLFLSLPDARNLLLDLAQTTSGSLVDLNLVHLNKLSSDPAIQPAPIIHLGQAVVDITSGPSDWFLLDSRWLSARPNRLHQNPLADMASLFPNLRRLSLAPTQLTSSMLLRLLYQTNLIELSLVETDFTRFTLQQTPVPDEHLFDHYKLIHLGQSLQYEEEKLHLDADEDLIEWGEEVPYYRNSLISADLVVAVSNNWYPIKPAVWRAALILRPGLTIQLRNYFLRVSLEPSMFPLPNGSLVPRLLSLWPVHPCPVSTVVFRTTKGPRFVYAFLNFENQLNLATYATTLTTLIISIELGTERSDPRPSEPVSNNHNEEWLEVNELLRSLPSLCPSLCFLALGGRVPYLSILTLLMICRQYSRRLSVGAVVPSNVLNLVVEDACCILVDNNQKDIPATVLAWYCTIDGMGKDLTRRRVATERCIAGALNLSHWNFVSSTQFQSELSDFLN